MRNRLTIFAVLAVKCPIITEQPVKVDTGGDARLVIKAKGGGLQFKWKKDGRILGKATYACITKVIQGRDVIVDLN